MTRVSTPRMSSRSRAAVEQGLRVVLLELLARAVALVRVAHVGERERSAGEGQDAAQHQRVVVAGRVVVRDDCPRWHAALQS